MNSSSKTIKKYFNPKNFSSDSFEDNFFNNSNTYIHPTAIIGQDVIIGNNVKIGPFCVLTGKITIGNNSIIYPNVSIGSPAQNLDTIKSLGSIEIGQNCKIREFASIGASKYENGKTLIGNNCYIMSYSHVAHDVTLEDNVVLINNVNLGGHVYVEKNAFLMANSAAHQFCRIGTYCALAPFSAIRQDIPPFCLFSGLPAKFYGLNTVALKRAGFSKENINSIKHVAKLFYQDKIFITEIEKQSQENDWGKDINVQYFLNFIKNSSRGISKKSAE